MITMEIKLTSTSTRAEVEACIGWYVTATGSAPNECDSIDAWTGPLQCVQGSNTLYLTFDAAEFGLYLHEWITLKKPMSADASTAETLQERKERLEKELSEVTAEIARDGAPEGWGWEVPLRRNTALNGDGKAGTGKIGWAAYDPSRHLVYTSDGHNSQDVDARALFAWVDRVRKLGETDL